MKTGKLKPDQYKLYYHITGKGPPLVFIHGILGFWRNFYSISQAFKKTHTSLLYDQRGHGQSFHRGPYTVGRLTQDLKNLLEELRWDQVALVGHSLGGYVSYLFAYHYPECVQKMIIVDASPWPITDQKEKIKSILLNLPLSFPDRLKAREFFKQSVEKNIFSKVMADFLMASLEKTSAGPVKFVFDRQGLLELLSNMRDNDIPSLIKNLKIPTLILRGKTSKHFLQADFEKTLELNPFFVGKEIKTAGIGFTLNSLKLLLKL